MANTTLSPVMSESDPRLWYIGVFLNMFASLCITAGMMLQKLVHDKMKRTGDTSEYWKKPLWILGFIFIISETVLDLVTFGFAPVSILAPLSSVTLIWNVILAPFVLGESLGIAKLLATLVILSGAVVAVIFAQHATPTYSLDEILELLARPMFVIFQTIMVGFLFHLEIAFRIIDRIIAEEEQETKVQDSSLSKIKLCRQAYYLSLVRLVTWLYHRFIEGFGLIVLYAIMTAALSGQAVGSAKLVIELLKATIVGEGQPCYLAWQWWLMAAYAGLIVFLLTRSLNELLRRFDVLTAIPIYQSLCILLQLGTAAFLFDEFSTFQTLQIICFPLGTLLCIFGIYLMSAVEKAQAKPTEEERRGSLVKELDSEYQNDGNVSTSIDSDAPNPTSAVKLNIEDDLESNRSRASSLKDTDVSTPVSTSQQVVQT